jgi:hypothetical protein
MVAATDGSGETRRAIELHIGERHALTVPPRQVTVSQITQLRATLRVTATSMPMLAHTGLVESASRTKQRSAAVGGGARTSNGRVMYSGEVGTGTPAMPKYQRGKVFQSGPGATGTRDLLLRSAGRTASRRTAPTHRHLGHLSVGWH